ncbi:hypothetical protein HG537_0C02200 [Torulaspora globosa]|uniref:Ubiquitin carboxyl-terminal hydrolase n=1 Tax=Torulaspora globosa TaxID=48254 RepID=A0A7H9HQJ7_9SACH|nr:hypothetical protein HG537_0C02200 [Torulaspora sp. CBS 2947]
MTNMKSGTTVTVSTKRCKTLARLSGIAEQFLVQDNVSNGGKDQDMMGLLQRCLDILETYRDEYRKLKDGDLRLTQDQIYEIYESCYVYYKIVHNTVLNKVPNLEEFQVIKKQANANDQKLMEVYNMLVKSLLKDERIGHIKGFLKEHSMPVVDDTVRSGGSITTSQLQGILDTWDDVTLLIDLRQRAEFTQMHIKAKNIICIEPISFKDTYTDLDVEKKSLITSPKNEIELFRARDKFKFIVLYTKKDIGKSGHDFYVQQETVLLNLLLNKTFAKPLSEKTKVCVLEAGISNWALEGRNCANGPTVDIQDSSHVDISRLLPSAHGLQSLPNYSYSKSFSQPQSLPLSAHYGGNNAAKSSNYFSLPSNSPSSSPQLSPSPHIPKNDGPTLYPAAPLLVDGSGARNHDVVLPQEGNDLEAAIQKQRSPLTPTVRVIQRNAKIPVNLNGNSKPPSQPIPSLPQLPHNSSSTVPPVKKYDPDFTVGLENMGNSCYINCIVQCLLGTHELTNIFLNGSYEKHINMNSKLGSKGVLARYFAKLIHSMYRNGSFRLHEKTKPVQPMQFKMACGSINSLFKESGQQDCQEFCQFLLDGLHEDLNQCGGNPPLKELSDEAEKMREKLSLRIASSIEWERFLTTDFSVIVDLFQGQYASQLKCQVCGRTSTTYQPFSVLSVPVPRAKSCNLLDCFREFTKIEKLEREEEWSCPQCKKKQPSTKKLTITRLPRNLIIHLKRFDNMLNKNNVFVQYPLCLDLTSYWANDFDGRLPPGVTDELPARGQVPPFNYKLYGVASHSGSLYGGHYTSYVYKGPNRGWTYFDDTSYRRTQTATECITPNAYVLFYHRVYQN